MRLIILFARKYPWQSAIMLLALLLAGIAEGFGLSALLPLISTVTGGQVGAGKGGSPSGSSLESAVTDSLTALGLTPSIGVLLVLIVFAIVLKSLLVLLAKKRVGYTVARVATDLRLELLRALLEARWEYFLRQPIGSLANAMATEAARTSKAYLRGATMAALLIETLVYTGVALLVSWKVTLASLVAGLVFVFLLRRLVQKARRAGFRQTELLKSLISLLTDTLQSIKPLKAMARENLADAVLEKKTTRLNKALEKQVFSRETLRAVQEPMLTALLAVGIYVLLVQWGLPLSTTMVLVFLLARTAKQLNKVQQEYQEMVMLESAYWSLQETIQEARQSLETDLGSQPPSLERAIHLDQVNFAYGENQVLQDASLIFPVGIFTAIVGPSGVGKTTIVDLITGLLRPQGGEIWIDDLPLAEVDLRSWRRMIGYVPQETLLLHDTILTNITLGDNDLSEKEVEYALRAAGAWEFVSEMPEGMYSTVGERGGMISGGQRQRVAVARALVHTPKLLILDEPTSGLDRDSEAAICETLQQLRGEYTILAISHQPTLMKAADRAYRLQDGKAFLVEDGGSESMHPGETEAESEIVIDRKLSFLGGSD
jgi:ATP-binding cassette subfamily C protein